MLVAGRCFVLRSSVIAIAFVCGLTSCRKPADARRSALEEAGYRLTQDDWFRAVRENNVPVMKSFHEAGFDMMTKDAKGDTALHVAAAAGAHAAADLLLDRGAVVDAPGGQGRTPLMSAALGGQPAMVRWLVSQGADVTLRDSDGFSALLLAVRQGRPDVVAELAAVHGESLDPALLLAALEGQAEVIDSLTNYGASVYARMEDGRTPLMVAAENGHEKAVKLLLEIGSSRFATDAQGRTAADRATAAGHPAIASVILDESAVGNITLAREDELGKEMLATVEEAAPPAGDAVAATAATGGETSPQAAPAAPVHPSGGSSEAVLPLANAVLSKAVDPTPASGRPGRASNLGAGTGVSSSNQAFPMPPLVMRSYREHELPVRVRGVDKETARIELLGTKPREVEVAAGAMIPGSRLLVVRVDRRMEDSKLNLGRPMEVSVVEVRDTVTGATREWISGNPATAHDPVALVEDGATGRRYIAVPGQRFRSADGADFVVADVRPGQLVIEDVASGAVRTLPLRGPRG